MIRISLCMVLLAGAAQADGLNYDGFNHRERHAPFLEPAFDGQTRAPVLESGIDLKMEVLAGPLEFPWGIAALPDGSYIVTERVGRMRHISADGTISDPIAGIPAVDARDQGGLLDVALAPDFAESRMIWWTYAKPTVDDRSATAAARGVLSEDYTQVSDVQQVFVQTPDSKYPYHFGSRVVFDGAGHVYITTGEHSNPPERDMAQDIESTFGKVVRFNTDGTVPDDNPFVGKPGIDSIWSLGHRNIQGAAMDPEGRLWTVEHGPRGGDELNLPEPGKNYGWPVVSYGINYGGEVIGEGIAHADGMEEPVYFWDPVIAPGGMSFYSGEMFPEWEGDLLICGMPTMSLVRLELENDRVAGEERIFLDLGRIRDVEVLADGSLLVLQDDSSGNVVRITRE